jgi:hypothetical protein
MAIVYRGIFYISLLFTPLLAQAETNISGN